MKTRREFLIGTTVGASILASSAYLNAQNKNTKLTEIVIYLYDGMTALDAIGVYEVLRFLPNSMVKFVAKQKGLIKMDSQILSINADFSINEISRADILVIPGGATTHFQMQDKDVLAWVNKIHETTKWTTSVCTGSGVLLANGILKDKEAVTHWASMSYIEQLGGKPSKKRICQVGKIITSAGVSAGIDMALFLVGKEAGEDLAKAIQLAIEYDPHPPFDSGSVEKSTPETVKLAQKLLNENVQRAMKKEAK
jgi:putative intracellular protease/amidase